MPLNAAQFFVCLLSGSGYDLARFCCCSKQSSIWNSHRLQVSLRCSSRVSKKFFCYPGVRRWCASTWMTGLSPHGMLRACTLGLSSAAISE